MTARSSDACDQTQFDRVLGDQVRSASISHRSTKTDSCARSQPLPKTNQDRIVRAEKLMSSDPSTDLSHSYPDNVIKLWKRRGKLLSPREIRALHIVHRRELVRRAL